MSGWISIHRSIWENWTWEDKPFSRGQAWIDLLLLANFKDKKTIYKGKLVTCKKGDVNLSITELGKRWGWSRHKARDFLTLLERDAMVTINATTHRTTITIEKYSDYQDSPTTNHTTEGQPNLQPKDNPRTTEGQPKDITNKDNKENKENKKDIIILTTEEAEFISILESIEGYPVDRNKDVEYYHTLEERYPQLNLIEAVKKWSSYVLDNPFKKNANHRSQMNTSFGKYVEWGSCKKATNLKVVGGQEYNPNMRW